MASQTQRQALAADGLDESVSIEIKQGDKRDICSLSNNKWLNSIMDARNEPRSLSIKSQKPKIQKAQPMLREVESNKKCYDPRVVSIGPCHHGKPELEPVQRLKIPLAREYVKGSKATIDELYNEVVNVVDEARKCYAEGLTERFNYEEFAQMMFLDGCFILQYIYSIVNESHTVLKIIHHAPLVRRDLFLLENQLPFIVLQVLMRLRFENHDEENMITGENMITVFIKRIRGESVVRAGLIEQIRIFFDKNVWGLVHHETQQKNSNDEPPIHLLELVRRQYIDPTAFAIGCYITGGWYSRRSAKDFKSVGIQFKPSKTFQLTDIDFNPTCTSGILKLPPMIIDDTTKSILLNLAAYEACPDSVTDFGVTSYICFMDSLIDHADDVKVLRSKGILLNFLGSDQQVADIFNEIATELVPSPHAYVEVKTRIEKHHKNSMKIWMAEWHHTYFRSPWTFIAVAAAILAITLSIQGNKLCSSTLLSTLLYDLFLNTFSSDSSPVPPPSQTSAPPESATRPHNRSSILLGFQVLEDNSSGAPQPSSPPSSTTSSSTPSPPTPPPLRHRRRPPRRPDPRPGLIIDLLVFLASKFLKTIPQAAATTCYVATHPRLENVSGKYLADCNEASTCKLGSNSTEAASLLHLQAYFGGRVTVSPYFNSAIASGHAQRNSLG
ncbi:hypothetical protein TEA_011622 [Camellia sinensis var. sinensis]|uniref:Uncharacterized protein n=1 Tax=Camellia sinensis var. sinensis TaxID=542762 RepID=A0A4S4E8N7_CAMSN|nr:hypothetical protein TEA_011622 [Camellia sinensis var. sinensis]